VTLLDKEIPGWVNRAPWIASLFPCLVPSSLLDIEDGPSMNGSAVLFCLCVEFLFRFTLLFDGDGARI
jgi:hypothetical protein